MSLTEGRTIIKPLRAGYFQVDILLHQLNCVEIEPFPFYIMLVCGHNNVCIIVYSKLVFTICYNYFKVDQTRLSFLHLESTNV